MLNLEVSKTLQSVRRHALISQFSDCFVDDLAKILQEMHWAIEDQDWDMLKSCSNNLKASAEAIDATLLAQACEYLVKSISLREYTEACKLVTQLADSIKRMRTFLHLYLVRLQRQDFATRVAVSLLARTGKIVCRNSSQ